jgi:hypothetical protein
MQPVECGGCSAADAAADDGADDRGDGVGRAPEHRCDGRDAEQVQELQGAASERWCALARAPHIEGVGEKLHEVRDARHADDGYQGVPNASQHSTLRMRKATCVPSVI